MKTKPSQALAYATWRSKMIADGYQWKSAFIPEENVAEFKALLIKWKESHQKKIEA